ncbi:hypothetical protein Tco_1055436 [Tanacetum coccineum]|uniref:Uncharacterized protein n=1 Tax=Tanacetum coccineum TaxID=301880 RepID=A0ABQ5H0K2_9ASTR
MDDLFNNLKAYESEVKGTSSSTTNSHNVAFLSSSSTNSATRAVNTTQGVNTASTQGADSSTTVENLSDAKDIGLRRTLLSDMRAKRFLKIYRKKLDMALHKELGLTSPSQIMDKCKIGLGYNVVPPPYTRNFMPANPDLVYPSLDDFVEVNESVSEFIVENPTVETNEHETSKKENRAPIIKDWVSESEEQDEPKFQTGNPQQDLKDKGVKITGKGKIRTGKLDFEDVYFVKELKFNLFSVSQMCDKKNSIIFTNTRDVCLSPDFKLTDESHVLLKVPRKDNMYSVDLKNVVP